ncbi:MAG: hypothetical protein Q9M82_05625, partial [Mariprofundus sp.]|nr:hypothetical protein [Mariprofundus sp.]
MKKYKFTFLLIIVLTIISCAPLKKVQLTQTYNPADQNKYVVSGQNTITGQAFLRQQGGGTVTCAGSHVVLFPATPFWKELVSTLQQGNDIDASNVK